MTIDIDNWQWQSHKTANHMFCQTTNKNKVFDPWKLTTHGTLHHEMIKDDLSSKLEITSACNFVIFKDTYSFFNKKLTVSLICLFVKTWVKNVAKMTTKWIISLHYYVICQVADIITGLGIQLVGQSCNCYHPRPQVADSGTTFRYGG